MGELSTGTKNKTYHLLTSDIALSNTTVVDTEMYVSVAANTTYRLEFAVTASAGGDGKWIRLNLGTAPQVSCLFKDLYFDSAGSYTSTAFTIDNYVKSDWDFIRVSGLFVSPATGLLRLQARKATNVGGDTTLYAGAYLMAQPI